MEYSQFYLDYDESLFELLGEASSALWIDGERIAGIVTEEQKRQLEQLLADLFLPLPQYFPVEQRDWLEEDQKKLSPIETKRFFLYPPHYTGEVPAGKRALSIEAAAAFGSGHHETTYSCIVMMEELSQERSFRKVLDVGCGSGILALAAAEIWQSKAVGCDIDPEAVSIAEKNAEENNIPCRFYPCDGVSEPSIQNEGPYDLILANIHSDPLCAMAKEILSLLAPDGILILSGFLENQVAEIVRAYPLPLKERKTQEGWVTLCFGGEAI